MRLSATAALNELGGFAYQLAGIELMVTDHVVREHHSEQGFLLIDGTNDTKQVVGLGLTQLEGQVLGRLRVNKQLCGNDFYTAYLTGLGQ